jgi:hypothetical protein
MNQFLVQHCPHTDKVMAGPEESQVFCMPATPRCRESATLITAPIQGNQP